jgi:putative addiction module killer protein
MVLPGSPISETGPELSAVSIMSSPVNFGDHKGLGGGLFELRFFFGPGFRTYYTIKGERVVFLLCGGDKATQKKDIEKARKIITELE